VYSRELVEWFHEREIPSLVTDTMGNEVTFDPATGFKLLLHCALMRNLGIAMGELALLDDLAADCAQDGQYTFLYVAAPLKIARASGSPVNPVVIKERSMI
jgi:kynurenine formamidase